MGFILFYHSFTFNVLILLISDCYNLDKHVTASQSKLVIPPPPPPPVVIPKNMTDSHSKWVIPKPVINSNSRADGFPFRLFFNTSVIVLQAVHNTLCRGNTKYNKCCSCNDSCTKYKDCCIDKLWYNTNYTLENYLSYFTDEMRKHETLYTCERLIDSKIQTDVVAQNSNSYFMINKCNSTINDKILIPSEITSGNNEDSLISEDFTKCENQTYDSVEETFPVKGSDGKLYRSSSCARCNGIFLYTSKKISYTCPSDSLSKWATDFDEIVKSCEILIMGDENLMTDVQSCFYTKPSCTDPEFVDQCHSYTAVTEDGQKNKDCAQCENGKGNSTRIRAFPTCRERTENSLTVSIILDFSKRFDNLQIQKEEILISQICLIVSVCAYLCLILTYLRFKELQNIPGLNALGMTITALVGDSIFLCSEKHSDYCQYVGVVLHYLFLAVKNWVLVICYDFACTFNSSTRIRNMDNKWSTVAKYSSFTFGVPLLFVVPTVIVDNVGVVDVGYSEACWVNHFEMRLWSFIIPVAVSHLISICILFRALIKIRQMKASSKKILHPNDNSRWETLGIAFKLVFGLLFVEIFGFVQVPGRTANEILTIVNDIIRGLKGVFLCYLYLFNRRVIYLLKTNIFARRERQSETDY